LPTKLASLYSAVAKARAVVSFVTGEPGASAGVVELTYARVSARRTRKGLIRGVTASV